MNESTLKTARGNYRVQPMLPVSTFVHMTVTEAAFQGYRYGNQVVRVTGQIGPFKQVVAFDITLDEAIDADVVVRD